MYYLTIIDGAVGFKVIGIHDILASDVPISDDLHNEYLYNNSLGNNYKVKNINGTDFDSIFEMLPKVPSTIEIPKTEQELRIIELEAGLADALAAIDFIVCNYS